MFDLLVIMLERVGVIIAVAFILTRFQFFKNMISHDKLDGKQSLAAILFFGCFGIAGTYLGTALDVSTYQFNNVQTSLIESEAIANSRVIGVVLAGLLGGYRVGIGAGLIAGLHRMTLGGFTGFACGFSTIFAGFVASAFRRKNNKTGALLALGIGALAEAMQMGFILLLSRPLDQALELVEVIGLPMIVANGVGAAIFMLIVHSVINEQEKMSALQAQKSLRIADQTLGYLRKGMDEETALAVCNILYRELTPDAVALTDDKNILAHVGLASDHHQSNVMIQTEETKQVIQEGELTIVRDGTLHCHHDDCPLGAAVIVPLTSRETTIGTLKLYYPSEKDITDVTIEFITGLSYLLSNQLEIAEADRAYHLAKETEIKLLQSQINPHFLFNSLNMVMSLIRTKPDEARKLLGSLSYFLRQNVTGTSSDKITIEQELLHVKAFLELIEARFIDRLTIIYEIDDTLLHEMIPPFTLQPIVENAIQHGIKDKEENCLVKITIHKVQEAIEIQVEDNGKGISPIRLQQLGKDKVESESGTGMGLYNVNRRLIMTFGEQAALNIKSSQGIGTAISFCIDK